MIILSLCFKLIYPPNRYRQSVSQLVVVPLGFPEIQPLYKNGTGGFVGKWCSMQRLCHSWGFVNWCVCLVCAIMLNCLEPVLLWEWEGMSFLPSLSLNLTQTHKHTLRVAHRSLDSLICLNRSTEVLGGRRGRDFGDCDWQVQGLKGSAFECSGRAFLTRSPSQPVMSLQLLT